MINKKNHYFFAVIAGILAALFNVFYWVAFTGMVYSGPLPSSPDLFALALLGLIDAAMVIAVLYFSENKLKQLLIFIIPAISIMFSLSAIGFTSPTALSLPPCEMVSGFECIGTPSYNVSGILVFTFLQNTGQTMYDVVVSFQPLTTTEVSPGRLGSVNFSTSFSQPPISVFKTGTSNTVRISLQGAQGVPSALEYRISGYVSITYNTMPSGGIPVHKLIGYLWVNQQ
jgi:hypothetical protein